MKKQFLRFPFTTAGVAQWQAWLAGLLPVQRYEEANLVEQGLYSFVPHRFNLAPVQVAFLDSLSPTLCALWATQIAYAIREQIAIELIKPENRSAAGEQDGTKFIESEGKTGSGQGRGFAAEEDETGYFLCFTITY